MPTHRGLIFTLKTRILMLGAPLNTPKILWDWVSIQNKESEMSFQMRRLPIRIIMIFASICNIALNTFFGAPVF